MSEAQATPKASPLKLAQARVGSDLNAKWRIDRVLGVGGMGAVFSATHKNNGTRAAVKVLHAEYARHDEIRDRFFREGRIANKVDHPARVPVLDDGVSDLGEPYLVMELLEGMTLGELLRKGGGRIQLEKLLSVFDPVLDVLHACHLLKIVHRDIKPANIFLSKSGAIKVLDFGVARMREPERERDATRVGVALGTASFIAPEQALGMDHIDGRADVFSVGACMYTGITGVRLHAAKSEAEEFVLAATSTVPSIARAAPELPAEVVAFVDRALAYDRVDRYQSAQEMRGELLRLVAALRAGQLRVGAQKQQQGVVVRQNEIIEEGGDRNEKEIAELALRVSNVFKQLGLAMASIRQYGFSHPQTRRALSSAFDEVVAVLTTDPHGMRWDVEPGQFTLETHPVWAPDRVPFDRIPHQLFADGVRKVQFKPGISEQELQDFVAILLRDVSSVVTSEDDAVTALWDRRFEHVAYLAIDSFAEGEGEDGDWSDLANKAIAFSKIDKDFDDQSLEARAAEMNLAGALREAGEAAAAAAVDPMTKATLGAQALLGPDHVRERFLDAFVPAFLDARARGDLPRLLTALGEFGRDQVALHAADSVFELRGALVSAFRGRLEPAAQKEVELEVARALLPVETLRAILTDIAGERRAAEGERAMIPRSTVDGIAASLDLLASDAVLQLACSCLDATPSDELRGVLLAYVKTWARGQEAMLAGMIPHAGIDLAISIVEIFAELRTPGALAGIEAAFQSQHLEVKLAALSRMTEGEGDGRATADRVRTEIGLLLEDPDVESRKRVLHLVAKMNVVAAGPPIARGIQTDEFHEIPLDERKLWLRTLAGLSAARGEAIAIELLSRRRILASEAVEQTRAAAAEVLGQFDSTEVIEALTTAAKQRWGTSTLVKDTASRSLVEIDARRQSGSKRAPGAMETES
jgi:serine/threonine protein kinase